MLLLNGQFSPEAGITLVFVTALATVFVTDLLLFNLCFMKLKKELKVDTSVRSTFDK